MLEKDVHVIDCDARPFIPEGWTVAEAEHQVPGRISGKFTWNPKKVTLHREPEQQDGAIDGTVLIKRLVGKPVLPAHILDYLLTHPELIPEEWKEKCVFFWGTVYRHPDGDLFVRYLCWHDGRWNWSSLWLDDLDDGRWVFDSLAAVLVR